KFDGDIDTIVVMSFGVKRNVLAHDDVVTDRDLSGCADERICIQRGVFSHSQAGPQVGEQIGADNGIGADHRVISELDAVAGEAVDYDAPLEGDVSPETNQARV